MQSNLKALLNAVFASIGNFFRRNPDLVRKIVLTIVAVVTLFFLVRYINQFLYKSKAGTDDVSISLLPSKSSVSSGEEFSIAVPLSTDPAAADKKLSGADIQVEFSSQLQELVDYAGFTQSPDPNYFNDTVIEKVEDVASGEGKILHLVLVANKTDQQLAKSTIINLKFKAKEKGSGLATFTVNKTVTQIVGTATDNTYTLPSEEITTAVKINASSMPPEGGILLLFNNIRIQGITKRPSDDLSRLNVKVTLKKDGAAPITTSTSFGASGDATWSGDANFPDVPTGIYSVFLKGPKHLQRKVCFSTNLVPTTTDNPSEDQDVNCPNDKIYIETGKVYQITIDPKIRVNMYAGDLPIDGAQDGLIDSLDLTYLRNRLGQTNTDYTRVGDLNLDTIIDTQDHSLPIAVLNLGINEDEE